MAVRGPSERDGKICPVYLTQKLILSGDHMLEAMKAMGRMGSAIDDGNRRAFEDAVQDYIVDTVKAEFDPDNGVKLRILDPENDFELTTGEVLELVQDCFYRPPSNLQIQVSRVLFVFQVIISLSH